MRRAFLITGLMTAFAVAVLATGAAGANFAGIWALDKTRSQGLDPRMQNADVTWVITQDDKQISIETKVTGGQPPAGGPGGGGGMGGGRGWVARGLTAWTAKKLRLKPVAKWAAATPRKVSGQATVKLSSCLRCAPATATARP